MSEEAIGSVEETGSSEDFRGSISEDLRNDPSLADFKDVNGLAKSYIHAQRMVGSDKISMPSDTSTPDDWNEFYNKLGRPETYELERPGLPEGLDYNQPMEENMLKIMHESGMSNKQVNAVYNGYMNSITEEFGSQNSGREAQQTEWRDQLKRDFGLAYDQEIDVAKRAASEFGGQEFLSWLDESGQGDNPMMVKMMAKIGKSMLESGREPEGETSGFGVMTPDSARQEIGRLQRDPNFMKQYSDSETDGHTTAIEKMQRLFSFAYPEE
jgi:hypothetical protein|tara:strand:+ start:4281 stop:5087 length:807 start_codon:yes stop_codon:yes gene_type:complete